MSISSGNYFARSPRRSSKALVDYGPLKWTNYFANEQYIKLPHGIFHIYSVGENGPILLAIHGGGYSGLSWALFGKEITQKAECRFIAVDLRGHGDTTTDDDQDLSLNTLAKDVEEIVNSLNHSKTPVIFIGHSLGGAVAIEVASTIDISGICIIDVVEGTALESLSHMDIILRGKPKGFKSISQGIQWSVSSGQTQNLEAARVSVPGQIKNIHTGTLAANETDAVDNSVVSNNNNSLGRIDEEIDGHPKNYFSSKDLLYVWRTDLEKTERFWFGWFKGMSQKFLSIGAPKVLVLSNVNGLDTKLTIGQMQGKFQLKVLPKSGHAIHEDHPHQVADIVATFLVKQKLAEGINGFSALPFTY